MGAETSCGQTKAISELSEEPPLVTRCGDDPIEGRKILQKAFVNVENGCNDAKDDNFMERAEVAEQQSEPSEAIAEICLANSQAIIPVSYPRSGTYLSDVSVSIAEGNGNAGKKYKRNNTLPEPRGKHRIHEADPATEAKQRCIENVVKQTHIEPPSANADRPFAGLLKAARPPPDALAAASWIGSCSQNALKADPQLNNSTSGCQCSGRLRSDRAEGELMSSMEQTTTTYKNSKNSEKIVRSLSKHQLERIKKQEPKMVEKAAKLEHIGKNLDDCNQQ